jgi:EAL domain-containing protein (putative c-di-GMP-specific phosphodiesterase class I)
MLPPLAKPFDRLQLQSAVQNFCQARAPLTENDVEQAIWNTEFCIYMQPIVDIATGRVTGAEALIRWQHPVRGIVNPDMFIPLVERWPVMMPLTLDVATQAVKAIAAVPGELSVAINVPPICLGNPIFPDLLAEVAISAGVSPSRITVEVTETAAMEDPIFTAAQVTRLRIKGFDVALDDFGTGYGSLVELHRMPVSAIKIDRSFVANLLTDKSAKAITRSIIGLGRSLDLQVVAEGVENRATLELLRSYECDFAQGYLFARPFPAIDLADWLRIWAEKAPPHTFG